MSHWANEEPAHEGLYDPTAVHADSFAQNGASALHSYDQISQTVGPEHDLSKVNALADWAIPPSAQLAPPHRDLGPPEEILNAAVPRTTDLDQNPDTQHNESGAIHPGLLRKLGKHFEEDFSGLKVERGLSAKDQARGVRAVSEPDKVAIDPGTLDRQHEVESQELIAEELAHVAQKRRGTVQPDAVDHLDDSAEEGQALAATPRPAAPEEQEEYGDARREHLEHEAKNAAARAVAGERAPISSGARAPRRQFGLWDKVKGAGSWVADKVKQGSQWVGDKAEQASSWTADKINKGASWVEDKAGKAAGWVGDKAEQATQWIGDKADKGWDWAANQAKRGANWLGDSALGKTVNSAASWLGDKVKKGASWLGDKANRGASWLGNSALGKTVSKATSWIGDKVSQGTSWAADKVRRGVSWAGNKLQGSASWLNSKLDQGLDWLGNTRVGKWAAAGSSWLMNQAQSGLRWVGDKVKKGWGWLEKTPVGKVAKGLYDIRQTVANTASRWVKKGIGAFDKVVDWGEAKVGQAADWITKKTKDIPILGPIMGLGAKYLKNSADFTGGLLKGASGLVEGVANMVLHPIDTLKGLGMMAEHLPMIPGVPNPIKLVHNLYDVAAGNKDLKDAMRDTFNPAKSAKDDAQFWKQVGNAFLSPYKKSLEEGKPGEAAGRAVFEIVLLIASGGESAAARGGVEAGNVAAKVSEVASVATKTEKVAEVASVASKTEKAAEVASVASKTEKAAEVAEVAGKTEKAGEVAGAAGKVERAEEGASVAGKAEKAEEGASAASKVDQAEEGAAGSLKEELAHPARGGGRADISKFSWEDYLKNHEQYSDVAKIKKKLHGVSAEEKAEVIQKEVENLRQGLLGQNKDIGRISQALEGHGVKIDPDMLRSIKKYNFDSPGLTFTPENFAAWKRLSTGRGTVDDVRYIIHEMEEVKELRNLQQKTGFDFMGKNFESMTEPQKARWRAQFDKAYLDAHSSALQREFQFVSEQVEAQTGVRLSDLETAVADKARKNEALSHMHVNGAPLQEHGSINALHAKSGEVIELSAKVKQSLRLRDPVTVSDLIAAVKRQPISP